MPAANLAVINQIRNLANLRPNAPLVGRPNVVGVARVVAFKPENEMEAACIALAKQHEENGMEGIVAITEQAIMAERRKNRDIHNRMDGIERNMQRGFGGVANALARME